MPVKFCLNGKDLRVRWATVRPLLEAMLKSVPWLISCCGIAIENGPCIVDFPIKSMVIFHSYVSLPGKHRKLAIEHCPVEIVDFPMKHGDFP